MRTLALPLALLLTATVLFGQQKSAAPLTPASKTTDQRATWAVVIGISDYQDPDIPDLRFAHRDAEAFANFLRSPAGGSLSGDQLQVLTNQNATAGRIAEALDALLEQTKEGDQVIIYFSGHGDVERKTVSQPGFLLCWDAPSRVYMGGGTYSLAYLQEIVSTLSTQNLAKVTVITDACHAGKLAGSQIGGAQLTAANLARQFANEVKILSCQPGELSLEGEQWGGGRGVFSYHLVEGLFGLADRNGDGIVSVGEMDRYLEDNVTTEAAPQSQVPMLLGNKTERLATVDGAVLAVQEKRFFPAPSGTPAGPESSGSADEYFAQLAEVEALAPLWGIMKRNYAAALQDDAQQATNI
jgi:protein O-mannosyl-transferase